MTYRLAKQDDYPQIIDLCKKHGIGEPSLQLCFVAEDGDVVVGFVSFAMEPTITALVSDNPLAARPLMDMMVGAVSVGNKYIRCESSRQNVIEQAQRYGFQIKEKGVTLMGKEL